MTRRMTFFFLIKASLVFCLLKKKKFKTGIAAWAWTLVFRGLDALGYLDHACASNLFD
jgi:hypothetical protein